MLLQDRWAGHDKAHEHRLGVGNHVKEGLYRELCSMIHGSLGGMGVWGRMDTYICMTKSLRCLPEIITTLLIGYTSIQNKKLKKTNKPPTTTKKNVLEKEGQLHNPLDYQKMLRYYGS